MKRSTPSTRIETAATLAGLTRILRAYERFVREHAIADEPRTAMHVALEEILSNVVRHASGRGARHMTVTLTATAVQTQRQTARLQGYEGDPCQNCKEFKLVRNGTCLKCMGCGSTSGCS